MSKLPILPNQSHNKIVQYSSAHVSARQAPGFLRKVVHMRRCRVKHMDGTRAVVQSDGWRNDDWVLAGTAHWNAAGSGRWCCW